MTKLSDYFDYKIDSDNNRSMEVSINGMLLLRLAAVNKGTAFTLQERIDLGLDGLLPPFVATLEEQIERLYFSYQKLPDDISKYQFLRAIQERSVVLFFALLECHLEEMVPIVYTPTIGLAVQQFSALYRTAHGITLCAQNIDRAEKIMQHYPLNDVRMIVVTDASAILGIGDQGMGGLSICIGKLALYTVGGGLCPFQSLPINLDVGTNREKLLNDPHYLGIRHKRLENEEYFQLVDKFVNAVKATWPKAIIQWEDFTKDVAFDVLSRYRNEIPCFNDDIQGTGAMALAGLLAACHQKAERLIDQVVVVVGAGAGGIGVASIIRTGMLNAGLSEQEVRRHVYVVDVNGLIIEDDDIEGYKLAFAQPKDIYQTWVMQGETPTLLEVVQHLKPHALLGLSGALGIFNESVVKAMAEYNENPIIFPLSNPNSNCEATPEDIIKWSDGRAIVATGSPFPDVIYQNKRHEIRQGNNAFIFPGVGLAAVLGECRQISDGMILESAYALADYIKDHCSDGYIYPPIKDLRKISVYVATRVLSKALADDSATLLHLKDIDIQSYVEENLWRAEYIPYEYDTCSG
ncbi:MAG: NAD-dependent malic enzyme [Methylococcales bacterium]|nr:MAG: NAD-dependent malic enzyme [Methylococcales bacterium]